jgi:hypothetical protein
MDVSEAAFRCGACGNIASVVRAVPAGRPVGFLGVLAGDVEPVDGFYVDFGGQHWKAVEDPERFRILEELLALGNPVALAVSFPEATPFLCRECGVPYCASHLKTFTVFDSDLGSPDWTEGTCPRGHTRLLDA